MSISKGHALETIKRSLVETQFRIRKELGLASARLNHRLHTEKTAQLKENQLVLDIINHELMNFFSNAELKPNDRGELTHEY